jgi:hypothetical protein
MKEKKKNRTRKQRQEWTRQDKRKGKIRRDEKRALEKMRKGKAR